MRCWMGMFIRQTEAVHVLFKWEQYKDNLLSVFQINKVGLAIYGGILGGVAVILIYCKVKKLSFWSLADTLIPSLVLGPAIGCGGNFVNQEAYGNLITNPDLQFFPYGVYIEELGQWHQATFFYESALNTLLLIVMLISYPHFRKKGISAFVLHDWLWGDTLLCRGTSY